MIMNYTHGEKEFLLKFARQTLEKYLRDGEINETRTANQKLWAKKGVFVTLSAKGRLRGCIGILEPVEFLIVAIRDNVLSAARDSRFEPVNLDELSDIKIEISVLSEPIKTDMADIKAGDGVIVSMGTKRATYLPQVWREITDREEFFSGLCRKAGLAGDAYQKDGVEFFKYQAEVFKESF